VRKQVALSALILIWSTSGVLGSVLWYSIDCIAVAGMAPPGLLIAMRICRAKEIKNVVYDPHTGIYSQVITF